MVPRASRGDIHQIITLMNLKLQTQLLALKVRNTHLEEHGTKEAPGQVVGEGFPAEVVLEPRSEA